MSAEWKRPDTRPKLKEKPGFTPFNHHFQTGEELPYQKPPVEEILKMPPQDERYVRLPDYLLKNLRPPPPPPPVNPFKEMDDKEIAKAEAKIAKQLPPEADITLWETLEEVYAPISLDNPVSQVLESIQEDCRNWYDQKAISQEQMTTCNDALKDIGYRYMNQLDKIADWYLENMFRIIKNPPLMEDALDND
ncbi:MAG: hypothetical protein HQL54_02660 [Magnetococcales bacterium]|nr:hypothetical protein [Magnetococcales bacterium]